MINMKIISATGYWPRFIILLVGLGLLITSCISPFEPDIQGEDGLLVVDGSVIKGRETQVIMISKSSGISEAEILPVKNCSVKVLDDSGNEFVFLEESPGKYVATIDDALLKYETQYKLAFSTPSGDTYESRYQNLLETPPVDNFYCIEEKHYSTFTNRETFLGLQFYVDLDAPDNASRYYRWQMEETWEIHAQFWMVGIYDGETIDLFVYPSDSLFYCWDTEDINELYTSSTINLSNNRRIKIPLYFISSTAQKMIINYSATVKQYALNEDAYDYWHQKESELNESGGIYATQPNQPNSNIYNTDNSDEQVLGFFWVASSTIKHLFLKNPFHKIREEPPPCELAGFYSELTDKEELKSFMYSMLDFYSNILPEPPIYITMGTRYSYNFQLKPRCVDCRQVRGDINKPEFWD